MSEKQYLDQTIRRLVQLESLKQSEIDKLSPYLKRIFAIFRDALIDDELTELTAKEFNAKMRLVKAEVAAELTAYTATLQTTVVATALDSFVFESKSVKNAFDDVTLPKADIDATEKRLTRAVNNTPLAVKGSEGKTITNLFDELATNESNKYINRIKLARYEGKTNQQIQQIIRGTRANKYTDGMMNVTSRQAKTLIRTTVQHAAMQGKAEFANQNSDIIQGEQWLSTLDSKTSTQCRSLDKRIFKLNEGVRPPLHHNCRSSVIIVLKPKYRGKTPEQRASMNGYTDNVSYYEWLKAQPKSFQDETIGKTRAELLRSGGLTADEFAKLQLNKNFKPLTLEQMREREPMAFERAGL